MVTFLGFLTLIAFIGLVDSLSSEEAFTVKTGAICAGFLLLLALTVGIWAVENGHL